MNGRELIAAHRRGERPVWCNKVKVQTEFLVCIRDIRDHPAIHPAISRKGILLTLAMAAASIQLECCERRQRCGGHYNLRKRASLWVRAIRDGIVGRTQKGSRYLCSTFEQRGNVGGWS